MSYIPRPVATPSLLIAILIVFGVGMISPRARADDTPWLHDAATATSRYVSVSGGGSGSGADRDNPMSFSSAITSSLRDVTFVLLPGTYVGAFRITASGTREEPVIFKSESLFGARIEGTVVMDGDYLWLWGLEFSAPNYQHVEGTDGSAIMTRKAGAHIINNYIHDNQAMIGIGGWNNGPDHVYYGNILHSNGRNSPFIIGIGPDGLGWTCRFRNPHAIYTQHDFKAFGYKYIVNNMFLDQNTVNYSSDPLPSEADALCPAEKMVQARADLGGPCRACVAFHAYHTNNHTSGFYMKYNVIDNGGVLIGGERGSMGTDDITQPANNSLLEENFFYKSSVALGYKKIGQFRFSRNTLINTKLQAQQFWGAGEAVYVSDPAQNPRCHQGRCSYKDEPNVFTDNRLFRTDSGTQLYFTTGAYTTPANSRDITQGVNIDPADVFNRNVYAPSINFNWMEGLPGGAWIHSLSDWQARTEALGKRFDADGTVVPLPSEPRLTVIRNDYDPHVAALIVENWTGAASVAVPGSLLSGILAPSSRVDVHPVRALHQAPVVSTTFDGGDLSLPLSSGEFQQFLIIGNPSAIVPPVPPPDADAGVELGQDDAGVGFEDDDAGVAPEPAADAGDAPPKLVPGDPVDSDPEHGDDDDDEPADEQPEGANDAQFEVTSGCSAAGSGSAGVFWCSIAALWAMRRPRRRAA